MIIRENMVERLRDRAKFARKERTATAQVDARYFEESADEIERLTAALQGLVVVPAEPTREMWAAMANAVVGKTNIHHDIVVRDVFYALVKACSVTRQDRGGSAE